MYKDDFGTSLTLTCILIGAAVGLLFGSYVGNSVAKSKGITAEDGWDYWQHIFYGGVIGGVLGGIYGWTFAGTNVAASISWSCYRATNVIGTTAYAIGRSFEKWFYEAYNITKQFQQVRYAEYRFDAIFRNSIVELKNYSWDKYSSYSNLIRLFTNQARNYMGFIGETIEGQVIKGVTFCFSSPPPQAVVDALNEIGVTVNWLP